MLMNKVWQASLTFHGILDITLYDRSQEKVRALRATHDVHVITRWQYFSKKFIKSHIASRKKTNTQASITRGRGNKIDEGG